MTNVSALALRLLPAGGLDLDVLGQVLAVLALVGDPDHRRPAAEAACVREVAVPAPVEVEAEVADRRVGDDADGRPQAALRICRPGPRHRFARAVEDEGEPWQAARAGDRVDGAGQR